MKEFDKDSHAKKWLVRQSSEDISPGTFEIAKSLNIHPIVAQWLYVRGYQTPKEAKKFLEMESEMLWDPFRMKDAQLAVDRIEKAILSHERILIYGDYDVDGVTSVCTFFLYLQSRGADVIYHIPTRSGEGHGVSCKTIDRFKKEGVKLIITVDTGVTAGVEVEYAKSIGIDFVITDHHECHAQLPHAVAVVNPHRPDCDYPFKELAGVGVVFKLICAIETKRCPEKSMAKCVGELCYYYADLVAIGTIADVMPIVDENRLIVSYGLRRMIQNPRLGLLALMKASSRKTDKNSRDNGNFSTKNIRVNSSYISFTIAPRINAVGRIKTASLAVELFLTDNEAYAEHLAALLCDANKERQAEENRITVEAFERIDSGYDIENNPFIVLESDEWHHGVIGIVASRITEKYGLPSILISFNTCDPDVRSDDDMGKGSGRSIKGINLVDALCSCSDLLPKFGGHELAAGLSIRRRDVVALREALCQYARDTFSSQPYENTIEADFRLKLSDISMKLAQDLKRLEPFGAGNPAPMFALNDVLVKEVISISAGKHSKIILGDGRTSFTAMCFSCSPEMLPVSEGDRADVLFTIDINEYASRKTVQLMVKDIRVAQSQELAQEKQKSRFAEIWGGAHFSAEEDIIPSRRDFADVYCLFRQLSRTGHDRVSHKDILAGMRRDYGNEMGYIKLKFIIRIFQEMNVLGIEECEQEVYQFGLHYRDGKVDLEKSNILRRLRSQQI